MELYTACSSSGDGTVTKCTHESGVVAMHRERMVQCTHGAVYTDGLFVHSFDSNITSVARSYYATTTKEARRS